MKGFLGIVFLALITTAGHAQNLPPIKHISGDCGPQSHSTEGPIGADLTLNQVRFYCNDVGVAWLDKPNKYLMLVFNQRGTAGPKISFEGHIQSQNPNMMDVEYVLIRSDNPIPATDGSCKFFYQSDNETLEGIFCGAHIDAKGRRRVASIAFNIQAAQ